MTIQQDRGKFVAMLRQKLGMTQEQFGQLVTPKDALMQKIVANWENGARPAPTDAIAETLGVSRDWLAGDTDYIWHRRIIDMRELLQESLLATTGDSAYERFRMVIRTAQKIEPVFCGDAFWYAWLQLDEKDFARIMGGSQEPPSYVYRKLANLVEIPQAWLETGNPIFLEKDKLTHRH